MAVSVEDVVSWCSRMIGERRYHIANKMGTSAGAEDWRVTQYRGLRIEVQIDDPHLATMCALKFGVSVNLGSELSEDT